MLSDVVILIISYWVFVATLGPLMGIGIWLNKKNMPFGVTFTKDMSKVLSIQRFKKRYMWSLTAFGVLTGIPITVIFLFFPLTEEQLGVIFYVYMMVMIFLMVFYSSWLHGVYYKKLKVMKRDEFGIMPVKPKARPVAPVETITESISVSNDWLLGLGVLILVATIIVAGSQYEFVPDVIYVWGEIEKSPGLFVIAPVIQAIVIVTMTYFNSVFGKAKSASDLTSEQHRAYRYAFSKYFVTMTLITLLMLLVMQCLFVFGASFKVVFWIIIGTSIVHGGAGLIYLFLKYGQEGERYTPSQATTEKEERVILDEDDNWIWGLYYYNPDDPSLWVAIRSGGMGITNNWAHRSSKGIAVIFIIFMAIMMILPMFFM